MHPPRAGLLALPFLLLTLLARPALADQQEGRSLFLDLGPVPDFALKERAGQTVTREDLRGKVWVAHFFFTCCAGGCSDTTAAMKRLQDHFATSQHVALVSISVYPENDTPGVLSEYASRWGADPDRWLFLTGPEEEVYNLVQKGFFQGVKKAEGGEKKPGFEVNHTFNLVVVDRDGRIRGYADGRKPGEVDRLIARVEGLVRERYFLPAVNASLNGTCVALLLLGYAAIRRRREALHVACMLLALAVSAAFLASYLYYHFVILDGKPTGFQGTGWVRPVYLAVLLSHTVLAVVVTPLALYTVYLGVAGRRARHVRVARWTFPLWLYVSATGVVVYWMLYHLYPPL